MMRLIMNKERVPFHITGYDGKAAISHPNDDGYAASVININDGRFLLRHAFGTTLFRKADANEDDWTFFGYKRAPIAVHLQSRWLEETLAKRQFGRFLRWAPSRRYGGSESQTCFLLLKNGGSGIAFLNGRQFRAPWKQTRSQGDICALSPEAADKLSDLVFSTAVNKHLEDPFVTQDSLKEEETEFICGSLEELERVTRWICQTDPDLFRSEWEVKVRYSSSTEISDCDREYSPIGAYAMAEGFQDEIKYSSRAKTLLDIVFEYNNFTGAFWEYNDMNGDRQSGYTQYPQTVIVSVCAPSAHERAEALLQLLDWLKGKVPESERRSLLG